MSASRDSKTPEREPALTLPGAPGVCGCGCGAIAVRSFLPGHDAKLRGAIARALRADPAATVRFAMADGTTRDAAALVVMDAHGWALPTERKRKLSKHDALLAMVAAS